MSGLADKLRGTNLSLGLETKLFREITELQGILNKLPDEVKSLLELTPNPIDSSVYNTGVLDMLGTVISHVTSLTVQEELKGIRGVIDEIMSHENTFGK